MSAPREGAPPDAIELRAAGLAALAEACVLYLPAAFVLSDGRATGGAYALFAAPFVATFVGGVLLACRHRTSARTTGAALAAAVVIGGSLGGANPEQTLLAVVVALLVTLRALSLGLRSWRTPLEAEIAVGAVLLGLETVVAAAGLSGWRVMLVFLTPLFFFASLAGRATTVWGSVPDAEDPAVRSSWIRRAALAALGLAGAAAAAALLAVRGGVLDRLGAWSRPIAELLISGLVWTVVVLARPLIWLIERIGIDPDALRRFLEDLRRQAQARAIERTVSPSGPSWWERVFTLLVIVGIGYAAFRAIRRLRPPGRSPEPEPRGSATAAGSPRPSGHAPPAPRPLRRGPPADAVRRWYWEVLLALRSREVVKEPSQTPAEFAPVVAAAFPGCAAEFRELTRAYEDVRYGSVRLAADRLDRLAAGQGRIVRALASDG